MNPAVIRIAALTVMAFVLSGVAYSVGGKSLRTGVLIFVPCWAAVSLIQVLFGPRLQVALVGDVVCGLGFVWLAWRSREGWPIFLVGIEAALLLTQTLLLDMTGQPTIIAIVAYNALIMGAPVFLAATGLWQRFGAQRG